MLAPLDRRAFIHGSTLGNNFNSILPIGNAEAMKASKRSRDDQLDADTPSEMHKVVLHLSDAFMCVSHHKITMYFFELSLISMVH